MSHVALRVGRPFVPAAPGLPGRAARRSREGRIRCDPPGSRGTSDNKQNGVDHSTFTAHLTGSDGSTIKFHDTAHVSTSASGMTVSFDKPMCG